MKRIDFDADTGQAVHEETELDLSPVDWWWVGYSDGTRGSARKPPADSHRREYYLEGYAVGDGERKAAEARPAVELAPYCDDGIPW